MQRESKNQLSGTDKIMNCKYDISHFSKGWCLFLFQNVKGGECRINVPGKARFHLSNGSIPDGYKEQMWMDLFHQRR